MSTDDECCSAGDKPLDEWFWHEMMDRASNAADIVERHIVQHHVCCKDAEASRLASEAADALCRLYQYAGAKRFAHDTAQRAREGAR